MLSQAEAHALMKYFKEHLNDDFKTVESLYGSKFKHLVEEDIDPVRFMEVWRNSLSDPFIRGHVDELQEKLNMHPETVPNENVAPSDSLTVKEMNETESYLKNRVPIDGVSSIDHSKTFERGIIELRQEYSYAPANLFQDDNLANYCAGANSQIVRVENAVRENIEAYFKKDEGSYSLYPVGAVIQELGVVVGRIMNENPLDSTNKHALFIEGSQDFSDGAVSQLNIDSLESYILYPGKVAVFLCTSIKQDDISTIYVHEMVSGFLPLLNKPKLRDSNTNTTSSIVFLGGPFISNNAEFNLSKLRVAMESISTAGPQALVVVGPFLPQENVHLRNGRVKVDSKIGASFVEAHEKIMRHLYAEARKMPNTEVYIVPHISDVHHAFPVPQPPLDAPANIAKPTNIHFCKNPSQFDVNGVIVSVLGYDAVSPLLPVPKGYSISKKIDIKDFFFEPFEQGSLFPSASSDCPVAIHGYTGGKVSIGLDDEEGSYSRMPDIIIHSGPIISKVLCKYEKAVCNVHKAMISLTVSGEGRGMFGENGKCSMEVKK